jgi:hypothetical protein
MPLCVATAAKTLRMASTSEVAKVGRAPTIGKNYLADTEALIFDKYRPCLQPAHMHGDCNVKRNIISVFK